MSRHMRLPIVASLLAMSVLGGCQSTPEHTNTLIFGTNTKFALDVSQDPTGVVGVTLGYKRQEAVWMPLLANSRAAAPATAASAATPAEPAGCKDSIVMTIEEGGKKTTKTSGCKFSGTAGTDSTNGPGAEDTYSVLATFSGEARGIAGAGTPATTGTGTDTTPKAGATGEGSLAQFFATGLAARILAGQGSSIVNTKGGSREASVTATAQSGSRDKLKAETVVLDRVMSTVTDKNGGLISGKLNTLATKATFKDASIKGRLTIFKDSADLRDYLADNYESATKPLFAAID